ncbi:restriction endonuclease subunit S [Azonexus sp.]|uniref:restriction endonuclease subunit S n=1 Tax=Azonexus sp. TaxID=1872668 RepID=UPI0035AE7511
MENDQSVDRELFAAIGEELFGTLPKSWLLTTLGEAFKWGSGGTPKSGNPHYYGGDIPWLVIGDLNDGIVSESATKITRLGLENSSTKIVETGTILVAMYGSIGKLGIAGCHLATNQAIAFARTSEIERMYLFYFLMFVRNKMASLGKGATQLNISQTVIKAFPFALAPLVEQHRIVAKIEELFSELDQGVASLKTAREQLKVYCQSLLKNAFEGKLTAAWRAAHADQLETATALQQRIARERQARYQQQLADWQTAGQAGPKPKPPKPLPPLTAEELAELPELPEGWGWVKLGALIDDPAYGTSKKCDYETAGVGVLRIPNVVSGKIDATDLKFAQFSPEEIAAYQLAAGDLLMIRSNGSVSIVGKCALVSQQDTAHLYAGYLIRLRPLQTVVLPAYLAQLLSAHELRKQIEHKAKSTSGVNNINSGEIQALVVPFCGLSEQELILQELESKLSEADQLDQTLATALQQADALRQSILKKAFSGQLVKQDKNDEPATALLERIRAARAASPAKGRQAKLVSKSLTNC